MNETILRTLTSIALIGAILGLYHFWPLGLALAIGGAFIYAILFEFSKIIYESTRIEIGSLAFRVPSILLLFYLALIALLGASLIYAVLSPRLHALLGLTILIVASFDTGGYIVGRAIGTHLLAPNVSPKKTWEGVIGGIMFSALAYGAVLFWFGYQTASWPLALGILIAIDACALLGDIFVSYLKRRAQIKDFGAILPGHGGILDRVDSLIFTVPLVLALHQLISSVLL